MMEYMPLDTQFTFGVRRLNQSCHSTRRIGRCRCRPAAVSNYLGAVSCDNALNFHPVYRAGRGQRSFLAPAGCWLEIQQPLLHIPNFDSGTEGVLAKLPEEAY